MRSERVRMKYLLMISVLSQYISCFAMDLKPPRQSFLPEFDLSTLETKSLSRSPSSSSSDSNGSSNGSPKTSTFQKLRNSIDLRSPRIRKRSSSTKLEVPSFLASYANYEKILSVINPAREFVASVEPELKMLKSPHPAIQILFTKLMNNKKNYKAWKLFAVYIDNHPDPAIKNHKALIDHNINLFTEMNNGLSGKTPLKCLTPQQSFNICRTQYERVLHIIEILEEVKELGIKITNSDSNEPGLKRTRSEKNMFITLCYSLTDEMKTILEGIRAGSKILIIEDLFMVYHYQKSIFKLMNKLRFLQNTSHSHKSSPSDLKSVEKEISDKQKSLSAWLEKIKKRTNGS